MAIWYKPDGRVVDVKHPMLDKKYGVYLPAFPIPEWRKLEAYARLAGSNS